MATGVNPNDHQISTIPALFIRRAKTQTTTIMAIAKAVPEMISGIKFTEELIARPALSCVRIVLKTIRLPLPHTKRAG